MKVLIGITSVEKENSTLETYEFFFYLVLFSYLPPFSLFNQKVLQASGAINIFLMIYQ